MDDEKDIEAPDLVRSFSDHLQTAEADATASGDVLVTALDRKAAMQDKEDPKCRRRTFQSSDRNGKVFGSVHVETELVKKAWEGFVAELLSEEDESSRANRIPWSRTKKIMPNDQSLKELKVSTVYDVLKEVEAALDNWSKQDRWLGGKAQDGFHKICKGLLDHIVVFDTVPDQNDYAATLCGCIRILIRASVNHVNYAEELASAICQVNDEIMRVITLVGIMNVSDMQRPVGELYVKLFHFFRKAMDWYISKSRRRFVEGSSESITKELKEEIQKIKDLTQSVARDAHARGLTETRETGLQLEATTMNIKETKPTSEGTYKLAKESHNVQYATFKGLPTKHNTVSNVNIQYAEYLKSMQEEHKAQQERFQREKEERQREKEAYGEKIKRLQMVDLGKMLAEGLRDYAVQYIDEAVQKSPIIESSPRPDKQEHNEKPIISRSRAVSTVSEPGLEIVTQDAVLDYSQHLEYFIVGLDDRQLAAQLPSAFGTATVTRSLQSWSVATSPQLLWIVGPPQSGSPSNMVGAAVSVLQTAKRLDMPCVAHACERARYNESGQSREEIGLIGLLYSLIRQLLTLLPPDITDKLDVSRERFELLDGSSDSWEDGLDLLADLLDAAPPLLLILIDGLGKLDHGKAVNQCAQLLDVLDECMASTSSSRPKTIKVLLTTSGATRSLRKAVPRSDMLVVEEPQRQDSQSLGDNEASVRLGQMQLSSDIEIPRSRSQGLATD